MRGQAADTFGFVGFDEVVREDWLTKSSYRMQDAYDTTKRLLSYQPTSAGSDGLLEVTQYLGQARGLVFIISDFHIPLETIEAALNTLSNHHVVPIVLWDQDEYKSLPNFGFSSIVDPESGQQRTLFFRKELKRRFEEMFAKRRAAIESLFMRYESPPYFVESGFDAAAISEYFNQFSAL